jgi:predicted PurR-regulated permease PerM
MYRDRSTTSQAWRTFLPILRERLGAFVVYGLFLVVVYIGLLIALIPAIILTCCVLGCLLLIPFIGAVVWLPVSYSIRAFGPEFLAQFGDAYNVWPEPPAVATDTP